MRSVCGRSLLTLLALILKGICQPCSDPMACLSFRVPQVRDVLEWNRISEPSYDDSPPRFERDAVQDGFGRGTETSVVLGGTASPPTQRLYETHEHGAGPDQHLSHDVYMHDSPYVMREQIDRHSEYMSAVCQSWSSEQRDQYEQAITKPKEDFSKGQSPDNPSAHAGLHDTSTDSDSELHQSRQYFEGGDGAKVAPQEFRDLSPNRTVWDIGHYKASAGFLGLSTLTLVVLVTGYRRWSRRSIPQRNETPKIQEQKSAQPERTSDSNTKSEKAHTSSTSPKRISRDDEPPPTDEPNPVRHKISPENERHSIDNTTVSDRQKDDIDDESPLASEWNLVPKSNTNATDERLGPSIEHEGVRVDDRSVLAKGQNADDDVPLSTDGQDHLLKDYGGSTYGVGLTAEANDGDDDNDDNVSYNPNNHLQSTSTHHQTLQGQSWVELHSPGESPKASTTPDSQEKFLNENGLSGDLPGEKSRNLEDRAELDIVENEGESHERKANSDQDALELFEDLVMLVNEPSLSGTADPQEGDKQPLFDDEQREHLGSQSHNTVAWLRTSETIRDQTHEDTGKPLSNLNDKEPSVHSEEPSPSANDGIGNNDAEVKTAALGERPDIDTSTHISDTKASLLSTGNSNRIPPEGYEEEKVIPTMLPGDQSSRDVHGSGKASSEYSQDNADVPDGSATAAELEQSSVREQVASAQRSIEPRDNPSNEQESKDDIEQALSKEVDRPSREGGDVVASTVVMSNDEGARAFIREATNEVTSHSKVTSALPSHSQAFSSILQGSGGNSVDDTSSPRTQELSTESSTARYGKQNDITTSNFENDDRYKSSSWNRDRWSSPPPARRGTTRPQHYPDTCPICKRNAQLKAQGAARKQTTVALSPERSTSSVVANTSQAQRAEEGSTTAVTTTTTTAEHPTTKKTHRVSLHRGLSWVLPSSGSSSSLSKISGITNKFHSRKEDP